MISLALGVLLGLALGRSPLGESAASLVHSLWIRVWYRIRPTGAAQPLLGVSAGASMLGLSPAVWRILLPIGAVIAALTCFGLWAAGKGAARVEKRVAKEEKKSEAKAVAIDTAVKTQQDETRTRIVYRDRVIHDAVEAAKSEVRNAPDDEASFAAVRAALDGMCDGPCQTPAGNGEADSAGSDGALGMPRTVAG